jgi:hypothetical protein
MSDTVSSEESSWVAPEVVEGVEVIEVEGSELLKNGTHGVLRGSQRGL